MIQKCLKITILLFIFQASLKIGFFVRTRLRDKENVLNKF
jgi:hypothetical protein